MLDKLFRENIEDDKLVEFIEKLLKVPGTNSCFKHVFKDVLEYAKKENQRLKNESGQTDLT